MPQTHVKVAGVWKKVNNTYVKVSGVWKKVNNIYVKVSGVWKLVATSALPDFVFNQTITANTTNYNLRNEAIAAGWNQTVPLIATVTVNSGVMLTASSDTGYAFFTGTGFPDGTVLKLINNGSIIGKGGTGGQGSSGNAAPTNGNKGGTGLRTTYPLTITNNGTIAGGGGGGGGGGGMSVQSSYPSYNWSGAIMNAGGGGGGGGAGYGLGGGGGGSSLIGSPTSNFSTIQSGCNGGVGTDTAGAVKSGTYVTGIGIVGRFIYKVSSGGSDRKFYGGFGGSGGALGAAGTAGTGHSISSTGLGYYVILATFAGGAGGAGGNAVVGNSGITWLATGTRIGAIVA